MSGTSAGPSAGTALVTGGGGFLGRAIVEQLLALGWRVRTLARGDYPELRALGADVRRGDVADPAAVAPSAASCDVVFHVAAKAGYWGAYGAYHLANVVGTRTVLEACRAGGVPRLVFTSSPSVVFGGADMEGADESAPYPPRYASHYSATKAEAERMVLAANCASLRTVALRPHLVWGPRDTHILPRLAARARAGKLRQVGDGTNRVDATYIDNAAAAHLLAEEALRTRPQAAGRAYFIANGEPLPAWELINRLLEAAGAPRVTRRISHRAARAIGASLEVIHTLLPMLSEPRMTRFLADELATSHWFDLSAAREQLGYRPRVTTEEGLRRLREWHASQHPSAGTAVRARR